MKIDNKVIFLSSINFINSDYKKYNFREYLNKKIKIEIWYLQNIFNLNYDLKPSLKKNKKIKIINIKTRKQFLELLNDKRNSRSLYYPRFTYNYNTRELFKILSMQKVNYLYHVGSLSDIKSPNSVSKKTYFQNKMKQFIKLKWGVLLKIIFNKIFLSLKSSFFKINEAPYLYLKGNLGSDLNDHKLFGKNSKLIKGHVRNYDRYLLLKKKKLKVFRKALFIDQGVMINPDHKEGQETNINKEKYYKSIYDFLKKLKKKFKYQIEISCHPKAPKKDIQRFFPKIKTQKNKTLEQIMRSNLILTHDSTAVEYAVFLKKPILFITNEELNSDTFPHLFYINHEAKKLNKKVFNLDRMDFKGFKKNIEVKNDDYNDYIKKHVNQSSKHLTSTQLIINKLKKDKLWLF